MAFTIHKTEFAGRIRNGSYELSIQYTDEYGVNWRKQRTLKKKDIPQNLTAKQLETFILRWRDKEESKLNAGVISTAPTFEKMSEKYLANVAINENAITTYEEKVLRAAQICKYIGRITVDRITVGVVEDYFAVLVKRGLSSGTIRSHKAYISCVMKYAKKLKFITVNEIKHGAEVPKQKVKNQLDGKAKKSEFNMFSEAETIIFKELLKNEPLKWECFFNIILATGARKGEVLALQFDDFDGDTIRFERSSVRKRGGAPVPNPDMKTPNSHRHVKVPQEVIGLVNQLIAEQKENALKFGELWNNKDNRLFTGLRGQPMSTTYPNDWFNGFIAKHADKLHKVKIHSFRHYFVSGLAAKGKRIDEVAAIIGDTVNTVYKEYYHFFEQAEKKNMEAPASCLSIFSENQENLEPTVANIGANIKITRNQKQQTPIKSKFAVGD